MKATERKIVDLFSEVNTFFSIPVYQRNYNWQEKQCQILFEDILKAGKDKEIFSHFIGSIVYIHEGVYTTGSKEFYIIDGQQRMTSLMLLFLSLYNKLKNIEENEAERIYECYIVNKFAKKDIKLKLLSSEKNIFILDKISKGNFKELEDYQDRNILKNYFFFKNELEKLNEIEIKNFLEGIDKLLYVDIALEKGKDDPQKIFESLNSTGLDLSQADLIRNYILMDLDRESQNEVYHNIWVPIEKNCQLSDGNKITSYVSDFIRDYLTLKNNEIPNKNKIFEEFKKFYNNKVEVNKNKLEDIKKYSEAYSNIINPDLEREKEIKKELNYLRMLDQTVINPFLIGILVDYREKKISKKDTLKILELLQSYLWRRFITGEPSNVLNKIFQTMYSKVSKTGDYYLNLEKNLINQTFPNNEELKSALKIKPLYKDKAKLRYVFEKIENHNHNELIDFNNEKITIEHIFPQKPNKSWREKYSEHELEEMKNFKDTISNLTLTGSNIILGNKSFLEKRDEPIHGFKNSKLFLNKYLGNLNEWNLSTMSERFDILFEDIIKIWNRPEEDNVDIEKITFVLKISSSSSAGTGKLLSGDKFKILKGSTISKKSISNNINTVKDLLIKGILEETKENYIFKEDYITTSPSAAAKLILGRNSNGLKEWKTFEGKSLKDYKEIRK